MKFIEVQVTEDEYEALKPYGTKWIRTGKKVIAIEIGGEVTLNFIHPTFFLTRLHS